MSNRSKIYRAIIGAASQMPSARQELIDRVFKKLKSFYAKNTATDESRIRADIGATLTEMVDTGVITVSDDGIYQPSATRPVMLRAESCEREIIALLSGGAMTKQEIRSALEESFKTKSTPTLRDDDMLFSFIGQILKRLLSLGVLLLEGGKYSIAPQKMARIEDISALLALKADFLTRLHARGGEYFEHYFMTLLSKYMSKHGKTVTEYYTTGGTEDGGIDGVIKTVDALGFRENIMVQTKNRLESTNETVVRAFYGAVCARQGSRGIFATTSDFHPSASKLLDGIDNCVGVDGEKIFNMAMECLYGIKRKGGVYTVDKKII